MSKKTIEDYKNGLLDKINSKLKEREQLVLNIDNMSKELKSLLEQQYALDETKIRINCVQCGGKGWVEREDGKKVVCPVCGGDEYNWAEVYIQPKNE